MFELAYEKRLIAEYEGDGSLLQKMTAEFQECRREMSQQGYPLTVRAYDYRATVLGQKFRQDKGKMFL
jgi:hypothetical protein